MCDPLPAGSGIICDPPAGPVGGEDIEDGTENVGKLEGVARPGVGEDIGSGVEDEGEPETDKENSSAVTFL